MDKSERRRQYRRERFDAGLCVYCGTNPFEDGKKGCKGCLAKKYETQCKHAKQSPDRVRLYGLKVRKEVIEKYGGACVCCNEANLAFLTIDHKNNNGNQERLEDTQASNSKSWYLKLRREPVREDLQVLCWNCNLAKLHFGECPHQSKQEIDFSPLEIDGRRKGNFGTCEKVNWCSDEELVRLVRETNCSQVAKSLGVHDTAVRGRLKRRGLYETAMSKTNEPEKTSDQKSLQRCCVQT